VDDQRYVPRVRRLGRWPFRANSWQVWDTHRNEWAPNALCGGALTAAMAASEGLNRG
jgi:hypothetical protein